MDCIVGFTGTQRGMTGEQCEFVSELIKRLKPSMVHHGGCIGADIDFDDICFDLGVNRTVHPGTIDSKRGVWHDTEFVRGKCYPLERNHHIVDESTILIAAPKSKNEEVRSGTWSTIRYAMCCGKLTIIVHFDGEIAMRGPMYWPIFGGIGGVR